MRRTLLFAIVLMSAVLPVIGQTAASDSETLRALLSEVRQLRKDLQTTSVAAQRVQIVLYRLEGQRAVIAQLAQSLQSARLELATAQKKRQEWVTNIRQSEEERDRNPNADRAALENFISQNKPRLESLAAEEERKRGQVLQLEAEMQSEQQKLEALNRVLDELDSALSAVGR